MSRKCANQAAKRKAERAQQLLLRREAESEFMGRAAVCVTKEARKAAGTEFRLLRSEEQQECYICHFPFCLELFASQPALSSHRSKVHYSSSNTVKCKRKGCQSLPFDSIFKLRRHYETVHRIKWKSVAAYFKDTVISRNRPRSEWVYTLIDYVKDYDKGLVPLYNVIRPYYDSGDLECEENEEDLVMDEMEDESKDEEEYVTVSDMDFVSVPASEPVADEKSSNVGDFEPSEVFSTPWSADPADKFQCDEILASGSSSCDEDSMILEDTSVVNHGTGDCIQEIALLKNTDEVIMRTLQLPEQSTWTCIVGLFKKLATCKRLDMEKSDTIQKLEAENAKLVESLQRAQDDNDQHKRDLEANSTQIRDLQNMILNAQMALQGFPRSS